jgi:hypothetical protein
MAAKFAFALLSVAAAVVSAEDMKTCGDLDYFPSEYACYNDSLLCPVSFGAPMLACGSTTCYDRAQYMCQKDGKLANRPAAEGPFVLTAESPNVILNGRVVNACGGYLAIGAGARQCDSCRGIAEGFSCGSYGNQTVFLPDGKMVRASPRFNSAKHKIVY